ncbi:hypothetical protein, partial [Candidatus Allofournierella merdipullorum]|uniref:hypothetical protein n=1 Tax=Candidatus Allofournierella merdipullorum TaxID=2838595 RepID=UPI003AB34E7F
GQNAELFLPGVAIPAGLCNTCVEYNKGRWVEWAAPGIMHIVSAAGVRPAAFRFIMALSCSNMDGRDRP